MNRFLSFAYYGSDRRFMGGVFIKKYTFIGGDARMRYLAESCRTDGIAVTEFGTEEKTEETLAQALDGASIVWLGVPAVSEAGTVSAPYASVCVSAESLLEKLPPKRMVVGGMFPKEFVQKAKEKDIFLVDYAKREDFAAENALLTAEAVLSLLISNTKYSLRDAKICLWGYGRISTALLPMLTALGAQTVVASGSFSKHPWIRAAGGQPMSYAESVYVLEDFDVVINTAPTLSFDRETLFHLKKTCLLIDLASRPGGVDFAAAKDVGIRTIWATGLPGKTAPQSAARVIRKSVENAIREQG